MSMMVPQQQTSQADQNVYVAMQCAIPVLNNIFNNRFITNEEYRLLQMSLQDPGAVGRMQTAFRQFAGYMPMAQATIEQWLGEYYMNSVRQCRAQMDSMRNMQAYGQAGVGYQQNFNAPMVMQAGVGAGSGIRSAANLNDLYGDNATLPSGYQEKSNNAKTQLPTETPKKRMASNSLFTGIDLSEVASSVSEPVWKSIITSDLIDKHTTKGVQSMTELHSVEKPDNQVASGVFRLEAPFRTVEGAVLDFLSNNESVCNGEFAHVVSFDQIYFLKGHLDAGKKFNVLRKTYGDGSIKTLHDLLVAINNTGDFGTDLSNIMLSLFNKAASVNFLKMSKIKPGVIEKMSPVQSLTEMSQIIMDNNMPAMETWREDLDAFKKALTVCLKASVNRIFRKDAKCFLSSSDQQSAVYILSDETTGIRIGGMSSRLAPYGDMGKDKVEDIKDKLKNIFALVVERKLLIHNLSITDSLPATEFKLNAPGLSANVLILKTLLERHGHLDSVCINCPDQMIHPLAIGSTYEQMFVVRRVF